MSNDLALPVLGALVMAAILLVDALIKWYKTVRDDQVDVAWWIDMPVTLVIFGAAWAFMGGIYVFLRARLCLSWATSHKASDHRHRGE